MQTHDEGEPWQDYIPPTQLPTPDAHLARTQLYYGKLHRATAGLVRQWDDYRRDSDIPQPDWLDIIEEHIERIAIILKEQQ